MTHKRVFITFGALITLAGFILSGPAGLNFVTLIHPQPAWTTVDSFVANYNMVQTIPYYFGFLLVAGMLILAAAHYESIIRDKETDQLPILLALICTSIFATLIVFNYICQTTFIHHLAQNYNPDFNTAITMFSMSTPHSVAWVIEMWGYAILGVATWLLSTYYKRKNRLIYALLITNGIVSILSVLLFIYNSKWLLTIPGIAGYLIWNLLMIVLLILIYTYNKIKS